MALFKWRDQMMRKARGGYIKNYHKEKHCMAFALYCGHIMRKKEKNKTLEVN